MLATLSGIITFVRLVQPRKARSSRLVTELGMSTLLSPVQFSNALEPIAVTELGIVAEFRLLHP